MTDAYIVVNDNYEYDDSGYSQTGPDGKFVHLTKESAHGEMDQLTAGMFKEGYYPEGVSWSALQKSAGIKGEPAPEELSDEQALQMAKAFNSDKRRYNPMFKIVRMQINDSDVATS